jgi:hypothetical protein
MSKRKHSKKGGGLGERSSLKQKQKQTQIVNVNIRGEPKRKSTRRRKRRQPKPTMEDVARADYLQPQQLPIVAYQTGYGTYPIIQGQPAQNVPPPQPFYMTPPAPRSISLVPEDIGQVGTEGAVEILEQPTKKEQLSELITPVELPPEDIPLKSNDMPQFNPMADVGGFDFGVGPVYEDYGIQYNEPFNALEQASTSTESSIPNVRKGTKAYYIQKIKEMTGEVFSKNKMKLNEFKTLYERIKGKKGFN